MTRSTSGSVVGRKRVISISWEETEVPVIVTDDDVTKDHFLVHAYSYAKAVEYMTMLQRHYARLKHVPEHAERGWQPK